MEMSIARRGMSSAETSTGGEPMSTTIAELLSLQIEDGASYKLGVKCP